MSSSSRRDPPVAPPAGAEEACRAPTSSMAPARDTIFALSTAEGRAGVAVIRVSGPGVLAAAEALGLPADLPPRQAVLSVLRGADGVVLDRAVVLRFAAPKSFTGEEVLELHCHGSLAVTRAVLARMGEVPGCRLAEPGEFTLRAFGNGRMDLAEVEGLRDLLEAETETQRRQALTNMEGALSRRVEAWRAALIRACALTEASIDWADEEVPEDVSPEVSEIVRHVSAEIAGEIARSAGAEVLRRGAEVALVGAPNAGKSSLLNALAGREAALTSPVAGTTRDVLELRYDLRGRAVVFLDMAGLHESDDQIERMGIERARQRAAAASLRIALTEDGALLPAVAAVLGPDDLVVRSKADLDGAVGDGLSVSAMTGEGLDRLLDAIAESLAENVGEAGLVAHARQRSALEACTAALAESQDAPADELLAEELHRAIRALDRLTGRVHLEEMLGEVFASFCVGK